MNSNHTMAGTVGGTFLSVATTIYPADLLKTAVLAAVGAVVSFSISLLLKFLIGRFKQRDD